ncbi:hypothetical protein BDB01DRAFT_784870 [Pilobolus umbonatus]|nr:hypothetical protein BDB01DRAFT_784870 [Pilobolus umbonatus]
MGSLDKQINEHTKVHSNTTFPNHAFYSPHSENQSIKSDSGIRELTPPYWGLSPCVTPNISSVRVSGESMPLSPQSRPLGNDETLSSCSSSSNTPKIESQGYTKEDSAYRIPPQSTDTLVYTSSYHPAPHLSMGSSLPPKTLTQYYQQPMCEYINIHHADNTVSYALKPSTTCYLSSLNATAPYNSGYYPLQSPHNVNYPIVHPHNQIIPSQRVPYNLNPPSNPYHPIQYSDYQTPNFSPVMIGLESRKENIIPDAYYKRHTRYTSNEAIPARNIYVKSEKDKNIPQYVDTLNNDDKKYTEHENKEAKPGKANHFPCEYPNCTKSFSRPYNLKSHKRTHTKERPYECPYPPCDWKFSRPHDLRRHQLQHTGQKPHGCKYCHRRFARSDALKRHLKVDVSCAQALRHDDGPGRERSGKRINTRK